MTTNARLFFRGIALTMALVLLPAIAAAQTNVIYVNGIWNTLSQHFEAQDELRRQLNESPNHTGAAKKSFLITGIYNNACVPLSSLQDLKEVYVLKTSEELYAADFRKIAVPYNTQPSVDAAAAARIRDKYLFDMTPGVTSLEADGFGTLDMVDTQTAALQLADRLRSRQPAIVVAHSQGNLVANLAYAVLAAQYGNDVHKKVRLVNVANPSEFSAHGLNLSHDHDGVIFADANLNGGFNLQNFPSTLNWTRTTPRCSNAACDFSGARPTFFGAGVGADLFRHGFVETYLSSETIYLKFGAIDIGFTPNAFRFRDRLEDLIYAAAGSLDTFNSGIVTFVARGAVMAVNDPSFLRNALPITVGVGDSIIFIVKFNSKSSNISDPEHPIYRAESISMKIGANAAILVSKDLAHISTRYFSDGYSYIADTSRLCANGIIIRPVMELFGASRSLFPSLELPLSPPKLSAFAIGQRNIRFQVISCGLDRVSQVLAQVESFVKE